MPAYPGGPPATVQDPAQTVGGFVGGGTPNEIPYAGPDGWYLLHYLDGSFAVVYLKNHIFQFPQHSIPTGSRTATPWFIGTSGSAISNNPAPLNKLLAQLGVDGKQQAVIMNFIGQAVIGHSVFVSPGAKKVSGFKHGTSPGGLFGFNPGKISLPSIDPFGEMATLLVRVLEGLVGVALLFLGLQALTGTGGQGYPVRTVKRYA